MTQNRRELFKLAALSTSGLILPGIATAQAGADPRPAFPPDVGRKFYEDGRVKPFAGNTIICHVPQQGDHAAYFNALLDVYREAPKFNFMRKITLLPPSSYHMTIFGGANDQNRQRGLWPHDVPLDAPMPLCNHWVGEKLKAFKLRADLPIRMEIDPDPPTEQPFVFRLLPANDAENHKLRRLIDRISQCLGIDPPGIGHYRFHTTMGYLIQWLSESENDAFQSAMGKWRLDIAAKSPEILFDAPEYCILDDMFAFHRQFYLS